MTDKNLEKRVEETSTQKEVKQEIYKLNKEITTMYYVKKIQYAKRSIYNFFRGLRY